MDMVKFSVVIPAYNSAWCIQRCIDSVISQTYTNWEMIVVNNYSTDATEEIINNYNDNRIHLVNNNNYGIIANSRNKGIILARGEWICFLDSDDWWTPNKLESCLSYLPEYDIIYHDLYTFKANRIVNRKNEKQPLSKDYFMDEMLLGENPIANSSVVIRKQIVDEVGSLTEDVRFVTVEDVDYWLRVLQTTSRVKYIALALGYYWIGNNASRNIKHAYAERALLAKFIRYVSDKNISKAKSVLSYKMARIFHLNGLYRMALKYYIGCIYKWPTNKYSVNSVLLIILSLCGIKK